MAKRSHLELWPAEIETLSPPKDTDVATWSNENIVLLPESSREPGPYRWERTPYARDILNLYKHPDIRHVVLKFGTQLGKTSVLYNMLGYIVDQEPYSTLLVYPSDDEARTVARTRVQPLFDSCQAIRKRKPVNPKHYQLDEMTFPGMVLYLVGSNSPTPLSQKPCRNVLRDEINKWPDLIGHHGDPLELSVERTKGFYDIRKIIDVSSPTNQLGNITRQEAKCQVILKYFVPCPDCGRLQTFEWSQIKFENRKDVSKVSRIATAKATAVYECIYCGRPIGDDQKEWILSPENGAGWFPFDVEEPEPSDDPLRDLFETFETVAIKLESVAFRLSSLYSPWIRWADVVEKFLEAHTADLKRFDALRTFTNDWLGEEWKDTVQEKTESDILKLRCEYPPMVVPKDAIALTLGVDAQKSGFYFVVQAWKRDYTSWLIRYGFVLSWDDIWTLIHDDTYEVEETTMRVKIWRTAIDTGGGADEDGDRSMTAQAYDFIATRGGQGVYGVKGSSREMAEKMRLKQIRNMPGTKNRRLTGSGVPLWIVDTDYFKDLLHSHLQIKDGDPGAIYLHSQTGEDFAKQMTAEEKRREKGGKYKWVRTRKDNHYLDAMVYSRAIADPVCFGGVRMLRDPNEKPRQGRRVVSRGVL